MKDVIAAVCQAKFSDDKKKNIGIAADLIEQAAAKDAQLIVLPEMACWWGSLAEMPDQAESMDGEWITTMRTLSKQFGVHLVAGSFPRKSVDSPSDNKKMYNSSVVIGPDGELIGLADKCHLFDVHIPDGPSVMESDVQLAGESACRLELPFGILGVAICYDLRFPELFREMHRPAGLDIIALPAAFHKKTGAAHWSVLARARAIENQCFVLAANQCGTGPQGYASYGHSMIIDPWGRILNEMPGDSTGVAIACLSSQQLDQVRSSLPALQHIRNFHRL